MILVLNPMMIARNRTPVKILMNLVCHLDYEATSGIFVFMMLYYAFNHLDEEQMIEESDTNNEVKKLLVIFIGK